MPKYIPVILVSLAACLFLYFSLSPSIAVPDIGADEAINASAAVLLLHNTADPMAVDIFLGRHFVLSVNGRHGALEGYLLLPAIFLGGTTLEALRITPVIFGVLTVILAYYFGRVLFNPAVGILSSFFLALNPFFIAVMKSGPNFGFSIPFFSLITLLLLYKYHSTRGSKYLYLGMFLLGLTFNIKGFYAWFIAAVFLSAAAAAYISRLKIPLRSVIFALLFFLLGVVPTLILYTKVNFVRIIVVPSMPITPHGINNLAIWENLLFRMRQVEGIVSGDWWAGSSVDNFLRLFFWCACLFLVGSVLRERGHAAWRGKIIFFLLLVFTATASSIFTFSGYWWGHFIILLPYVQLLMAVAVWKLFVYFRGNILTRVVAVCCMLAPAGFYLNHCQLMHKGLEIAQRDNASCDISALTRWLMANKLNDVLFLDPDTNFGARFLSNLKLGEPFTPFWIPGKPDKTDKILKENVDRAIRGAGDKALVLTCPEGDRAINKIFKSAIIEQKKEIEVLKKFISPGNGEIRFIVLRLKQNE